MFRTNTSVMLFAFARIDYSSVDFKLHESIVSKNNF